MLREALRQGDVVCRLGGEEFVVIAPGMDLQSAYGCAERLRAAVQAQVLPGPAGGPRVTLSVGVAVRTARMSSPADLLKAADEAVYAAKQAGRNRVSVAAPAPGDAPPPASPPWRPGQCVEA